MDAQSESLCAVNYCRAVIIDFISYCLYFAISLHVHIDTQAQTVLPTHVITLSSSPTKPSSRFRTNNDQHLIIVTQSRKYMCSFVTGSL